MNGGQRRSGEEPIPDRRLVAVVRELRNRWFEQVRASLLFHASISEPTGAAHANCSDGRSRSRAFLPPTSAGGVPRRLFMPSFLLCTFIAE
jgi:hypothetical protein